MLGSAIIVFREVLEAALIIGIIAAATRGMASRRQWITLGLLAGVGGSLIVAALTGKIASLAEGFGQELTNAAILGLAAIMLAWHNIWMARHGRELARGARQVGQDVVSGQRAMSALAVVVALAVLREGSETALFMYGLLTSDGQSVLSVASGGVLGLAAGAAAGWALYVGFVRIPMRAFFAATSGLILFLAASMASQAALFLVRADVLPSLSEPLWNTAWLVDNSSLPGQVLHTLIGYDARPAGMQVVFYVLTVVLILVGMQLTKTRPSPTTAH